MWPAKDKGAINTRVSTRDKFGSWCASSHASPSTITGVPVDREADVITALKLLCGMGVGYGRCIFTFYTCGFVSSISTIL